MVKVQNISEIQPALGFYEFDIIEKNVTKRVVRHIGVDSTLQGSLLKKPVDVEEYGAVEFVLDVDQFR